MQTESSEGARFETGQPPAGRRPEPGTPSLLRELNDRAALELLLDGGPLTRAQLSERTGVSKVTVSQMLARLEERGLVMIVGDSRRAAAGRTPRCTPSSPPAPTSLALYVEFDLVSAAVADVTGQRVAEVSVDPNGADDPVGLVRDAIEPGLRERRDRPSAACPRS